MSYKSKPKNSDKNQQMLIIGGVVAIVVVVFAAVLYLAAPTTGTLSYEDVLAEKDENGEYIVPENEFSGTLSYEDVLAEKDENGEYIVPENEFFVVAERTDDGAFVIGNPDAPVTVVAWEDFLCSHCQAYQSTVKRFLQDYVFTGKASFEFRMLPISQQSGFVFSLVECVAEVEDDPAAFWPAHDAMFNLTTTSGASFDGSDFASEVGVPYGALLDCAEDANQYQIDQAFAGQYPQQITGTPAVAWRFNDSDIRLDIINRQPTYEDLAGLVQVFGQ